MDPVGPMVLRTQALGQMDGRIGRRERTARQTDGWTGAAPLAFRLGPSGELAYGPGGALKIVKLSEYISKISRRVVFTTNLKSVNLSKVWQ